MADHRALRKVRGAFFTPPALADFLTHWAIRSADDVVLEPSCGEAAFLLPAAKRLIAEGAPAAVLGQHLFGTDLHEPSTVAAINLVRAETGADLGSSIFSADFFDLRVGQLGGPPLVDAVIGNPPYIRYQDFAGSARVRGQAAALEQGVSLGGLASSWAPFLIHASSFLRPGGRLGLVLPAELLSVNYAAPIRRFLLEHFAQVRVILFEERVFPDVSEEVVLLLAEGEGPCDAFDLFQIADVQSLPNLERRGWRRRPEAGKWTSLLLPEEVASALARAEQTGEFVPLGEWGSIALGMVTGRNDYFCLSEGEARDLCLHHSELLRVSPPGSRHLRGLTFTSQAWKDMTRGGAKGYLFYPRANPQSSEARAYIARGEQARYDTAYKCQVRSPWWQVPLVEPADLFVTYMNFDGPRLVSNRAHARHVNSVHGLYLKSELRRTGLDLLPLAVLSSATLLGAELVGRAYGGGLLKLEPREAAMLPLPAPDVLERNRDALQRVRPQVARELQKGALKSASQLVDEVLLVKGLGLRRDNVRALSAGRDLLFARRQTRSAK